jgi:hypothetical protein
MISTFFLLYTLPFFLLTTLVEMECFVWATLSVIVLMAAVGLINHIQVFPYIKLHGFYCLECVVVYIILGIVWSFARWFLFLLKFKNKFRSLKEAYISKNLPEGTNFVPADKMEDFKYYLRYPLSTIPTAFNSKNKIIGWMAFWPCSVIGYIVNDPFRRLFNTIFTALKNSYQKIADSILNDTELK